MIETSRTTGLASQVSVATIVTVIGASLWFGGDSTAGDTFTERFGGVVSTTATWVTSSSAWANVSMTRRTYVCCSPTRRDCCDTSVWPTSGPLRLPARQLASVAFWSGSNALPLSVNDAPLVEVHSTVWSGPAVAVGGWFRSEPSRATSTVIGSSSWSGETHGPPAASQSGEAFVQTVLWSPSHVPTGFSPSTVEARLPFRSHPLFAQSTPSVSGCSFNALTASPLLPRRPLPVPRTVSCAKTASTPLSVVRAVSPDALRSKNVGSDAQWTEKVIGDIASPVDSPTAQLPPGQGSP